MNENRRIVESLNSRIAAALERIADALELQNEFAKARSKTAEKVAKHRAGKKVTVTSQVVTEKKEAEKREERTKEENREEESKDTLSARAHEANVVPSGDSPIAGTRVKQTTDEKRKEKEKAVAPMFLKFWAAYPGPRRRDREKCFNKFVAWFLDKKKNTQGDEELFAKMMNGLEAWKKTGEWQKDNGEFICAPLVWLNNARWEAEVKPWTPRTDKPVVNHNFRRVRVADNYQPCTQEQIDAFNKEFNEAVNRR